MARVRETVGVTSSTCPNHVGWVSSNTLLTAAHDDPEFGEVVTRQERNPSTKLIEKVHNIDMLPSGGYSAIAIAP